MENILNDLFKEFFESFDQTLKSISTEGFDIKTEKTPNGIVITAVQKPVKKDNTELLKYTEEFKKYIESIDDFILESACEEFADVADITLEDLQILVDEAEDEEAIYNYTEIFKDCIKSVAIDFIDEFKEKYEID